MSLEAESEAETTAASKDYDLLVIGPGHLGARVATLWQQKFPNAMIALKANRQDLNREAKWHSLGFISHQEEENGRKYNYVLFSAPPSGQFILYLYVILLSLGIYPITKAYLFFYRESYF